MSGEDRGYLRELAKKKPSLEIFIKLAQILTQVQEKMGKLLITMKTSLLEAYKPA